MVSRILSLSPERQGLRFYLGSSARVTPAIMRLIVINSANQF